ncbi:MAG: LPS export ABC transporter periplasmic protein LptC [Acidobacteria bacterium]|nr:LPS export ABC transporter periplasmic protein LptC [Acidobacteriota bacterium]MCA1649241.1 LPS export ABC transporter periplasmic protein LptC [Acidobacteriota bacterium]
MAWQKHARLGVAAFIILFAATVIIAWRQRKGPPPESAAVQRTDPAAVVEDQGGLYEHFKEGRLVFSIRSARQLTYADGRSKLLGVTLTLPDRGGRTIEVQSDEANVIKQAGQDIGTARLDGNVRLKTSDGVTMTAGQATYNDADGVLSVPGPVQFQRGRMVGAGVGATYDRNRDVLWLLEQARVTVAPDATGAGSVEATAGAAGLARAEHYLKLTGNGRIKTSGRNIEGTEITLHLTPDDRHIQLMELRGNSRIAGAGPGGGPETMSAVDIDLRYGEDGRTLQNAKLTQNAVVQLAGGGPTGRRVAASSIDIAMAPDGATVTNLTATDNVQVDLPGEGEVAPKRIRAQTLVAVGAAGTGLQQATFAGGVEYTETRTGRRDAPASPAERTARSQRLIVQTQPGLGAIQQADFRGNVRFTDGPQVVAEAPRGLYHVERDRIDLSPSDGDPGPAPSVNDGRVFVEARTIEFTVGGRKLKADTNVRSLLQGGQKPSTTATASSPEVSRLPSMLKQDQPVTVTSNKLQYDGSASTATYEGNARLWQNDTRVEADTIVVDDRTGNLTARGTVRTVMFFADADPKTKQRTLAKTTGRADLLVYEDARRLAVYTGSSAAKANINGPQGDVTGDRIALYLKSDVNELERAEADGAVIVKESVRTAKGSHLTYTAADDRYVMTGAPLEVVEETPPDCKKTVGAILTFQRSADRIDVAGPGGIASVTTPVACAAERHF